MENLSSLTEPMKARVKANMPPELWDTMFDAIAELQTSGKTQNALQKGDKVPEIASLQDAHGESVSLQQWVGRQPVVLTFYRGGWCPFCSTQLRFYQNYLVAIRQLGAELIAISPELPEQTVSTAEKNRLVFPVLSDPRNEAARQFGIVHDMGPEIRKLYGTMGVRLEQLNGDDSYLVPYPATYVLDKDGVIAWHFGDPDYTRRAEVADILNALNHLKR